VSFWRGFPSSVCNGFCYPTTRLHPDPEYGVALLVHGYKWSRSSPTTQPLAMTNGSVHHFGSHLDWARSALTFREKKPPKCSTRASNLFNNNAQIISTQAAEERYGLLPAEFAGWNQLSRRLLQEGSRILLQTCRPRGDGWIGLFPLADATESVIIFQR
jgi:hypothetical protein